MQSGAAMHGESCTFDEAVHLAAAYASRALRDDRMLPEQPPLGRLPAALPLLVQDVTITPGTPAWNRGDHWRFGYEFLFASGNDPGHLLAIARAAMLAWPVLLLLGTWAVSRRLFGEAGGLVSLALLAFSPSLIAHGHLVAVDVAVAALIFLAAAAFERWLERPSLLSALASGALLGSALATKHTALVLLPLWTLQAAAAYLRSRPGRGVRVRAVARALGLTLVLAVAYAALWGHYGFRYATSPEPDGPFGREQPSSPVLAHVVDALRARRLLPEAYLDGVAMFQAHAAHGHPSYAAGQHTQRGLWWFFPLVLLVKTPVAAQALAAWGALTWLRGARAGGRADFLAFGAATTLAASMLSPINVGIRHALPVLPFLAALAGGLGQGLSGSGRRAVLGLLAASALECVAAAPFYLAYFNLPASLLGPRHELMVDSNLDWGQDLARLERYMDRNGIESVKLCYFGGDSPRRLGLRHETLPGYAVYKAYEKEWPAATELRPGDVVAISATFYKDVYMEEDGYYARLLAGLRPFASIGHSILLFRIPPPGRPLPTLRRPSPPAPGSLSPSR